MRKILLAIMFCFAVTMQSCSFFESVVSIFSRNCTKNVTDKYVFRASAEATSPTLQMSQDKANADARRIMLEQIDEHIANSVSYKSFLRDDKFEEKIDLMRNKVLESSEISCSHVSQKSGVYKYSTTLQINRSTVDNIISEYK